MLDDGDESLWLDRLQEETRGAGRYRIRSEIEGRRCERGDAVVSSQLDTQLQTLSAGAEEVDDDELRCC